MGGTTVKDAAKLPKDLLADEKHTGFSGEKAYIATTVGHDGVLERRSSNAGTRVARPAQRVVVARRRLQAIRLRSGSPPRGANAPPNSPLEGACI